MMKYMYKICAFLMLLSMTFACDEDPTEALEEIIKEDKGYLPVIATFTLTSPEEPVVQPGEVVTFDLRYWSEGNISQIEFWLIEENGQTLIREVDYAPAYSEITRTDSIIFDYAIPATIMPEDTISVVARVLNEGLEEYPASASVMLTVPE